jgi:hypothetical protein
MSLRQQLELLETTPPRGRFPSLAWAWPTGERDLLLRAAILEDLSRAAAAYQEWQSRFDFDDVEFSKMRLLAAISTRISANLLKATDRARLKGVERQLWTHCRFALRAAEPAFASLAAAAVEVMVLKGAARAVLDMANLRGRYASEVDLLVRPRDYAYAIATLSAAGWKHDGGRAPKPAQATGVNLVRGPHGRVDVHQFPCHQLTTSDHAPHALWARASRHEFLGHSVLLPSATDRLVIAFAHGGIDGHAHSDWLVDSAHLIRSSEVDWGLFESLCAERRIEAAAAIALSYLRGPLELPVPDDVLCRLEARARRRPLRFAASLLEARPKREHSVPSALARGAARAGRLVGEGTRVWHLQRLVRRSAGR